MDFQLFFVKIKSLEALTHLKTFLSQDQNNNTHASWCQGHRKKYSALNKKLLHLEKK